jgi:hypothetical protein
MDNESGQSIENEEDDSDAQTPASHVPKFEGRSRTTNAIDDLSIGSTANTASTLRSRFIGDAAPTSIATGTTYSVASKSSNGKRQTETRENILISDRVEREKLTEDLLDLTKQLKGAQKNLHEGLAGERKDLHLTAQGLDKNVDEMDAAGKRMGTLRRMTEGKGWFGRMMLYAYIAGLWLLALIIVFVLPKLRF